MGLELRDLRWAIVAAQHRSLRQAADALRVKQSTLSRRLRDLEHQLRAPLFERTNGGTRPTIEGQEFLESARRIVEETEALTTRVRTRARGESGRLTIGVHASLSAGNLRATLVEYRERFPDVETVLVDGSSDHLTCGLASSAIDVAFMISGGRRWEDKTLPVWNERLVVAVPDKHQLSNRETVCWEDLDQESVLLPMQGPGPELYNMLTSKSICSNRRLVRHDVSLDRLLTLVGAGWGILLALEGATGASYSGVTFRELHDARCAVRLTFSACWREANTNPSLRSFLAMLRERYLDLSEAPNARQ